jgi:hypothetical protein
MNNTPKRVIWIIGIAIVLAVVVIFWLINLASKSSNNTTPGANEFRGISGDPIDITHDFYLSWLTRKEATEVSSTTKNPLDSAALSSDMQKRLASFDFSSGNGTPDPVLCQSTLPPGFRTKKIFSNENAAQVLVLSSDKQAGTQATVTLASHDGLWEITNITCGSGEQAPDTGEFSFDTDGFLLKDSLPDTFDKSHWYLVFEQNGVKGHTAPLILGSESTCTDESGNEGSCNTGTFSEAVPVHVQGQMTESGVDVVHIQFMPSN